MKKITSDITEIGLDEMYILEAVDVPVIKAALDYVHHRMTRHRKTVTNYKDLQRLRKEFGIINEIKIKA
jgi:hypothetical protein